MQIGALIPIHTFLDQVEDTVDWCIENYPKLFDSFKIVVVTDTMLPGTISVFKRLDAKGIITAKAVKNNSLKSSIVKGIRLLEGCDVINIIEADAIPNFRTLAAMLEAYEGLPNPAAICPIFTWNGNPCYPTNRHWYKDKLISRNFLRIGEVREVGKAGIPFLFSLWNPKALSKMKLKEDELPDVYYLDGNMGKILHPSYKFYRVMDHQIQHIGGGKNK